MPVRPTIVFALFFLAGCAHYHFGTEGKLAFATLYVDPVENKSRLPQASAIVSTQIRETLLRDDRVVLVNDSAQADAVLHVTLVNYSRVQTAAQSNDTGLARKFQITLQAVCSLRDNRTGKVYFENRSVDASREIYTDSGQQQTEYNTVPLLAETMADNISHAVLDVW